MSGGSMDYVCFKVEDAVAHIEDKEIKELVKDLAKLLHDLEWWDSGDYSRADYEETVADFKSKWFGDNRHERLKEYIRESLDKMEAEIDKLL